MDVRNNTLILGWIWTLTARGVYATHGLRFEVPLRRIPMRARPFFLRDTYEHEERALIAEYVKSGDSVLEIGGGIGVVACEIDAIIGPSSSHVVVEANPALISLLARNRKRNAARFVLVHGALAESPVLMFRDPENFLHGKSDEGSEPVVGYSLGDLFSHFGDFNVLVLDIEGAERILLEQLAAVSKSIRTLIIEFHPLILGSEKVAHIRRLIETLGFVPRRELGDVIAFERTNEARPQT